jgi:hypothetical protein
MYFASVVGLEKEGNRNCVGQDAYFLEIRSFGGLRSESGPILASALCGVLCTLS